MEAPKIKLPQNWRKVYEKDCCTVATLISGIFCLFLYLVGIVLSQRPKPLESDSSLLIVEAGVPGEGALFNSNASGWAPWVVDANGKVVPFKTFDAESRLDSFFYSENLASGKYTLKGFYHVFVDYSKLPEGDIPFYDPFANYSYHVKQEFPLDNPVEILLGKGEMATFGRYYISSNWTEGLAGTGDQRWRVNPSTVKISGDKNDQKALRVAQNWRTPNWTLWNQRNPAPAADY